jgi:hypothetical protein
MTARIAILQATTMPKAIPGGRAHVRVRLAALLLPCLAVLAPPASADYGVPERAYFRWSGAVATLPGGVNSYVFAGPTVTVTVPAGQTRRVRGSATAALGLATAATQLVHVGLCYQNQGGGAVNTFSLSSHIYHGMDQLRRQYAINDTTVLSGGTYNVGYCVKNLNPISITNTDKSAGYLVVTPN